VPALHGGGGRANRGGKRGGGGKGVDEMHRGAAVSRHKCTMRVNGMQQQCTHRCGTIQGADGNGRRAAADGQQV